MTCAYLSGIFTEIAPPVGRQDATPETRPGCLHADGMAQAVPANANANAGEVRWASEKVQCTGATLAIPARLMGLLLTPFGASRDDACSTQRPNWTLRALVDARQVAKGAATWGEVAGFNQGHAPRAGPTKSAFTACAHRIETASSRPDGTCPHKDTAFPDGG